MAADTCPSEGVAAVEFLLDERICSEFEQCDDRFAPACLGGEVDGGDALAVTRSAERAALIGVGAGEAFYVREALNIEDPFTLLTRSMNIYS